MLEKRENEMLQRFEEELRESLLRLCTQRKMVPGYLFSVDELDELWNAVRAQYMADAVPQIAHYPMAAIAWAGFLGIAAAIKWDSGEKPDASLYSELCAPRGFDCLDEEALLMVEKCGDKDAEVQAKMTQMLQSVAESVLTSIRKEGIEPQSVMAFHVFTRAVKVVFQIGVSMTMFWMGYRYEKAKVSLPS